MRISIIPILVLSMLLTSCGEEKSTTNEYVFTQRYCATITTGGIVGTTRKCYHKTELVIAESVTDSSIVVRIAEHSARNKTKGPWNYQELLEIPLEVVKEKEYETN